MARARNIKPAFFTSEQIADQCPLGRLLFIGLWTLADFKGDLEWKARTVKVKLLPFDDCDIDALAINLDKSGLVRFYSDGARVLMHIPNFTKHQNPHLNEKKKGSDIPQYSESMRQAIDCNTLAINRDKSGAKPFEHQSDPADSLNLIPDSLIPDSPNPESLETPLPESDDSSAKAPTCPTQKIIDLYTACAPSMVQARIVTDAVRATISARWKQDPIHQNLEFWKSLFEYCEANDFLSGRKEGRGGKPFRAGLEWIVKSANFAKIVNGNFDND